MNWWIARVVAGAAALLSSFWLGHNWKEDNSFENLIEPSFALLTTVAAWLFSESKEQTAPSSPVQTLHPADIEIALRVREQFTPANIRALRSNSFAPWFNLERYRFAVVAGEWSGVEFEFSNGELKDLLNEIISKSTEFDSKLFQYAEPIDHGEDGRWSLVPDDERGSDYYSSETFEKLSEIDKLARELADAAENFERSFRRLSPESYGPSNQTS